MEFLDAIGEKWERRLAAKKAMQQERENINT
jgi:hypothetical protein